jgi:hypothetical protein
MGNGLSLEQIEKNFDSFIRYIPQTPTDDYYWYDKEYVSLSKYYNGKVDQRFADSMVKLFKSYLDNNRPSPCTIDYIAWLVIKELVINNLVSSALTLAEIVCYYPNFNSNKMFMYKLTHRIPNSDYGEQFAHIAMCANHKIAQQIRTCHTHYGLKFARTGEEVMYYCSSPDKIFVDMYFDQFKMLFLHVDILPYIMLLQLQNLDNSSTLCLMWLLTKFKYTNQQLRLIFNKSVNCDQTVIKHLITSLNLTQRDFLDMYWQSKEWRQKLLDMSYLTVEVLQQDTDTIDKENILLIEFKRDLLLLS